MAPNNLAYLGVINVMVIFDIAKIISKHNKGGDQTTPVTINDGYYLVTESNNVLSGQGTTSLQLKAVAENEHDIDTIRWREYSISFGVYQCFVTAIVLTPPTSGGPTCLSPAEFKMLSPTLLVRTTADNATKQTVSDNFWEAAVQDAGTLTYQIQFQLVDITNNFNSLGYFQFETSLQVVAS